MDSWKPVARMKNVLVVAAHPDDEILGCGGTIAYHSSLGDVVRILFIADGVSSPRRSHINEQTS